jgi:hypothetical protein
MKLDVSVPLDAALPACPDNTPFSPEPMNRVARAERSNVSTLHMSAHSGTIKVVGVDDLPVEQFRARIVRRRS